MALSEQPESRLEKAGSRVRRETVEEVEAEGIDADALDRLAAQLCRRARRCVKITADIEDERAAIEVQRLYKKMVDDAGCLARARLAEDRNVFRCVGQVECDVGAGLYAGG